MKSKIIMLLAIVMGLITTFFFYNYVSNIKGTPASELETVETVVAKRDIKKNELISQDMLEKVKVVDNGLYKEAIRDSAELNGKYALADIAKGEPFLPHRVLGAQEEKLFVSRKIAEGYRGVSIGLNYVQSVSNLIEPEDYVDVIYTKLGKPELDIETVSSILLEHVRVLAVGRRMVETIEGDVVVEYSSATLELKSPETVRLVNAANDGILTLTLHSRIKGVKK
ncbi:MAG: Flp pilus assembly protein CpaB [Paenibacillaceae bacterium]